MRLSLLPLALLTLCLALPLQAVPTVIVPEAPMVMVFNGVGLVQLRHMVDAAGATLDISLDTITVKRESHTFVCTVRRTAARQDGQLITLPVAPEIQMGLTFIPVRPLVTALGGTLIVDELTHQMHATFSPTLTLHMPVEKMTGTLAKYTENLLKTNLLLIKTDGSEVKPLTYTFGDDLCPNFTADGSAIVFLRYLQGTASYISLRRLDQEVAANLTAKYGDQFIPRSEPIRGPDDTLVFTAQKKTWADQLFLIGRIHTDGTGYQQITSGALPLVSADGQHIAFMVFTNSKAPAIHFMNADGSQERELASGIPCALSPDGSLLAYIMMSKDTGTRHGLAVIETATGKERYRTAPTDWNSEVSAGDFSPDGKQLVYMQSDKGLWMTDHSHARQLTKEQDFYPKFSPDGTQVAFLRYNSARFAMYLMRTDGSECKCLASNMFLPLRNMLGYSIYNFSSDGKYIVLAAYLDWMQR
jgi:Tol biopolymer transport system component